MSSLPLRILIPSMVVVFFGLTVSIAYFASRASVLESVHAAIHDQARNKIETIQTTAQRFLQLADARGVRQLIASAGLDRDLLALFVTDRDGTVIASMAFQDHGKNWRDLPYKVDPDLAASAMRINKTAILYHEDQGWTEAYAAICDPHAAKALRATECGMVFYRVDEAFHQERALSQLTNQTLYIAGGTTLGGLAFWLLLNTLITTRVRHILQSIDQFVRGDRTSRTCMRGRNELAAIGQSVDEMLDRIVHDEGALRQSESHNRAIVETATYMIITTDSKGIIRSFNAAAESALGYSADEIVGNLRFRDLFDPGDLTRHRDLIRRETGKEPPLGPQFVLTVAERSKGQSIEGNMLAKDGTPIPVAISIRTLTDEENNPEGFLAIAANIRERKEAEEQLRLADKVFQNAGEAILVTDENNRIIDVNDAYLSITGYPRDEIIGRDPKIVSSGKHDRKFYEEMWSKIHNEGKWSGEIWDRRKNGEVYPKWLTISAVKDETGRLMNYVGIFSDTTDRKAIEEQLEYLAYYDSLTDLPNRTYFRDRLAESLGNADKTGRKVGLMFIDLNGFKYINDTLGHEAGDRLLGDVANRLRSCFRPADTLARLGGDEFTVILPDIDDRQDAEPTIQKIIASLRDPITVAEQETFVGASIGISVYPDDGADISTLMKCADAAMYWAKREQTKEYAFFAPQMTAKNQRRVQIENGLRRAIERNELRLLFQPVADIARETIVSFEALLRWNHHELGEVEPSEFVPVAEECGLMIEIDRWVLSTACAEAKKWESACADPPRISVNISVKLSRDPGFVGIVRNALRASRLPPSRLILEVTEGALMIDTVQTKKDLDALRMMGVGIAIDDFGTGYSSLAYLKKFPIDTLKIDQSFVRDLPDDPDDVAIVESILSMVRALGIDAVAEGVETEAQREFLYARDCHFLQGYLFSRPLPAEAAVRLIDEPLPGSRTAAV